MSVLIAPKTNFLPHIISPCNLHNILCFFPILPHLPTPHLSESYSPFKALPPLGPSSSQGHQFLCSEIAVGRPDPRGAEGVSRAGVHPAAGAREQLPAVVRLRARPSEPGRRLRGHAVLCLLRLE